VVSHGRRIAHAAAGTLAGPVRRFGRHLRDHRDPARRADALVHRAGGDARVLAATASPSGRVGLAVVHDVVLVDDDHHIVIKLNLNLNFTLR
jgi:hypothetical protein